MWPYTDEEYDLFFALPGESEDPSDPEEELIKERTAESVYIWLKDYKANIQNP